MYRKHKERHFIRHTIEHLFGVLVIVLAASTVAYFASAQTTLTTSIVTPTTSVSTETRELEPVTTSISTTGDPVFFSATPAPETDCSGAQPMTKVFFAVSETIGGSFEVTSDTGMLNARFEWGEYPLPNGTYTWKGVANSGFTPSGTHSGSFELYGTCPASLPVISSGTVGEIITDVSTKTVSSIPLSPPSPDTQTLPRPILKVFFDNKPVTDPRRVFDDEDIELRVIASLAKKVTLVAIPEHTHTAMQLGNGVIDDLLTTPGMDIWTYVWNVENVKEASYSVFARILRTDGTIVETVPVVLHVMHQPAALLESQMEEETPIPPPSVITSSERQQILDRVSDPALCTNAEECKIFCTSHGSVEDECAQFAQINIHMGTLRTSIPSLSDDISDEQIQVMLHDSRKRPMELLEIIVTPDDFRSYCAQSAHTDVCMKALINNDLASPDTLERKKADITRAYKEDEHVFTERVGARMFVDGDSDGVTDYDEVNMYHTDPNDPDTDHDGFFDGAEMLAGTNPSGTTSADAPLLYTSSGTSHEQMSSGGEEMNVENPLIAGEVQPSLLSVTDVSAAEIGLNEKGTTTAKKLKLSGKALPNSFVRVYIFSDPIVVTVKADESGMWTYVLDKELPDGTHHVISAITDSGGRILAKSESLPFIKEAAAVSLGTQLLPSAVETPGFFSGASLYAFIAILIALLGLGLSVIGFMVYRKGETHGQIPAS